MYFEKLQLKHFFTSHKSPDQQPDVTPGENGEEDDDRKY